MTTLNYEKKAAVIVKADKKLVDELLATNPSNRNIRRGHVGWLKAAIKTDQFLLTGQGVTVSKEGTLIDGQHRLQAIRESGYPAVELLIVTGVDEKAKIYIDQHSRRSAADMLKVGLDKAISPALVSVLKMDLNYRESDKVFTFLKESVNLEKLVKNADKHEKFLIELMSAAGSKVRTGAMCALFHYAQRSTQEDALAFAQKVNKGTNLSATSPAYKIREYILDRKVGWARSERATDYAYMVTACLADYKDEKLTKLVQAKGWNGLSKR